jgi:hypothetical protein
VIRTQITVHAAIASEPSTDRRNSEVFSRTLFTRDDQIFHLLDAGIDAGQHEGGGKSIEVRRFGFNLDHGGVNGGLRVMVDNVQQNQGTQGHGQGYLGALKSVTPELVEEVTLLNGPFSAEHGDFSGLGVVLVRLREAFPDRITARLQGGSFGSRRGFLAWSPGRPSTDAFIAWEGSTTDGPFVNPLHYGRNNVTANYARRLDAGRGIGVKFNGGINRFDSSGQVPLDEVAAGRLDRFGFIDPSDGGASQSATVGLYFRQESANGAVLRANGFAQRSLLDLFSNFTFYLNHPDTGDAFGQHDSRLQEGANLQYARPQRLLGTMGMFTAGLDYLDSQINVGLYSRAGRTPVAPLTHTLARITNAGVYAQHTLTVFHDRVQLTGGLRYDEFRFRSDDQLDPGRGGTRLAGNPQPKLGVAYRPSAKVPLAFHANYGRGISSADARAIAQRPELPRVGVTDFYEFGTSHRAGRFSLSNDWFRIDRSHEQVYVADDGSFEFRGPTRSYGFESKASLELTRKVALNGGLTKVANAYYRGTSPRAYVDRAPHLVANAGVTVSGWKGWSGSVRMRAINHYRADPEDPGPVAAGHTVWDCGVTRALARGVELNLTVDNLLDRNYYEMQNYFESRLMGQDARFRIHATPGYPRTAMVGLTFHLFPK